jgi:hypothetical protein
MKFAINFAGLNSLQRSLLTELAFGERLVFQKKAPPGPASRHLGAPMLGEPPPGPASHYKMTGSLSKILMSDSNHAGVVGVSLLDKLLAVGAPLYHPVRTLSEQLAKGGAIESLDLVVHLDDRVNLWLDLVEYWKANPHAFAADAEFMWCNMGQTRGTHLKTIAEQDMRSVNQSGVLAETEAEAVAPTNF